MKNYIDLFVINIKDIWKNNKLIYTIFMLFMFISFTVITISYNLIRTSLISYSADVSSTYSFALSSTENLDESIKNFLKDKKNNCAGLYFTYRTGDSIIYVYHSGEGPDNQMTSIKQGRWFSDEEIKNGEKVILVPSYAFGKKYDPYRDFTNYEIGSTLTIDDVDYTVVGGNISGIRENKSIFTIVYNSLNDIGVLEEINIIQKNFLYESDIIAYPGIVLKYFNINSITHVPRTEPDKIEGLFRSSIMAILSMGIINMLFVYKLLLDKRKPFIGVFRISGMSKKDCIAYLYFEFLIWLVSSFLVSCIFSWIFMNGLGATLFSLRFSEFTFMDYVKSFIVFFLLYVVMFIPVMVIYVLTMKPVNIIHEGEKDV